MGYKPTYLKEEGKVVHQHCYSIPDPCNALFLCFISFIACVTVGDCVDGIQSFKGFMLDEFILCKGLDFSSCLCDVTNNLEIVISKSGMMTDMYQSSFICAWGQELHTKFIGSGLPCMKNHI